MSWADAGLAVLGKIAWKADAIAASFGLGGGVGLIKFLAHCPPPNIKRRILGGWFDTVQDLVSNRSRIGERSNDDGSITWVVKPPRPILKSDE